ncbi:Tetratricopeptide repeat protein 1 [Glycine soja]|uniref:Tetratricopeptide repeat protein 1 n=1 Tax=Glycine soja TaxID=3848 RepID=A0A0B2PD49_GLYSO|nr:Tetratricopeptide repeat protein 1 [Glycine soja]
MVVIEQEESEHRNANPSNDASDGFETASDTDLADSDTDLASDGDDGGAGSPEEQNHIEQSHTEQNHTEQSHTEKHQQQQQTEQEPEHDDPQSTESSENNALINEEESRQKALDQANEAKVEGNKLFVEGKYEEALLQYELALQVASDMPSSVEIRSICHSNRGVCFLKLEKYDNTIKECTKALELNPVYVKALVRRGEAHEKLEHFDKAIDAQVKDMGNSFLRYLGLKENNFKAVKDPNTGSYSISFQR